MVQIDQAAGTPVGALDSLAGALPFGFAFGAGMLAAVNPCGLAMLPAYLTLYLGTGPGGGSGRLRRAALVSLVMTGSFVAVFGLAGATVTLVSGGVAAAVPALGLAVGVVLVLAASWSLAGSRLYSPGFDRVAAHLAGWARGGGAAGYAAYGVAYGLASLGCALPVFLSVVGTALNAHDFGRAMVQFVLYGAGMGLVVTSLTLVTASFRQALVARLRAAGSWLPRLAALVLLLAGSYLVFYWLALSDFLPARA